jgi:GNAT superfamily N-acetyltransferase
VPDLTWSHEPNPTWDADKTRVIGGAPEGAFVLPFKDGDELPGDWWSARGADGEVLGYGRLDTTWGGDAEILLAVARDRQESGVGTFILEKLENEAASRGINYVHNRIRDHEQRDIVHDWLVVRGFRGAIDGDLRKRVGAGSEQRSATTGESPSAKPAPSREAHGYDPASEGDRGPGHEESGGYVNIEDHQY